MYQNGEVKIIKCKKCNESFPAFTFVADTDMVTNGCAALSAKGNKIILTMMQPGESDSDIETRIGSGYKLSLPVRYIHNTPSAKGLSFQEYNKVYKPPIPIYACIYCDSDSEVIKTESKEQFLAYGSIEVANGS